MKKRILALLLVCLMAIPFAAFASLSVSAAAPAEPTATGTKKIYMANGQSGDGTTASTPCGCAGWGSQGSAGNIEGDPASNTGAVWDKIKDGGTVVITGKCYIGAEWAIYPTAAPLVFTGKDGGTNYLSTGDHKYFNSDGQKGMVLLADGKTVTFMGDVIFEDTVLLDRSPANCSTYRVGPNGRFVVKSSAVIDKSNDDVKPQIAASTSALNVMEGGVAFLHATGFSNITGKGTVVIDKTLYKAADFANFEGTVMDTTGAKLNGTGGSTEEPRPAAEVIYVKAGGTGDGTAADKAFGTIADAFTAAAAKKNPATIQVIGNVPMDMTTEFKEPAHTNKITITGKGTDGVIALTTADKQHWVLNGPDEFNNIEITATGTLLFRCHFNPITFGENCKTPAGDKTYLTGGIDSNFKDVEGTTYNADKNEYTGDVNVTILSGTFKEIIGYARNSGVADAKFTGNGTITIGGDAVIENGVFMFRGTSKATQTGNSTMYIDGGKIGAFATFSVTSAAGACNLASNAKFTMVVTDKFDVSKSFDLAKTGYVVGFAGSTSVTADSEAVLTKDGQGTFIIQIEANNYDANAAKIGEKSFTTVTKIASGTGMPAAPKGGDSSDTGDSTTLVVALVLVSVLALGAVVVSKKQSVR